MFSPGIPDFDLGRTVDIEKLLKIVGYKITHQNEVI
jgi:hypothetical protein